MSTAISKSDFEAFGNLMLKIGEAKAHIEALGERAEAAEARAERYRKALEELVEAWGESDDDTDAPRFIAAMDAARAALRGEG